MLLALLICHLSVLTIASPFHKYPFVFVLDVGNEELEKTTTEQIRISTPGGSVALRYPAIGDGEAIAHVRVSGIDFGTDLKASIVDGGPGYKYVVLVLMGNIGVPYDAVVTVQTLQSGITVDYNVQNNENYSDDDDDHLSEETETNNSAEDMSDSSEDADVRSQVYVENSSAELTKESSNVYNYAQSDFIHSDDKEDGDDDNSSKDIDTQYVENSDQVDQRNAEVEDDDEGNEGGHQGEINVDSIAGKYETDSEYAAYDEKEPVKFIDNSLYEKYQALKPHLYDGVEVYSKGDMQEQNSPVYSEDPPDEDSMEIEQIFNDEEVHNDADKYKDSNNNNFIHSEDSSAVAY